MNDNNNIKNNNNNINNQMTRKQNNFGSRYGNEESITEKAEWISNIAQNYKDSKKVLRRKYTLIYSEQHSKKVSN